MLVVVCDSAAGAGSVTGIGGVVIGRLDLYNSDIFSTSKKGQNVPATSAPILVICAATADQTAVALNQLTEQYGWSRSTLAHPSVHVFDGRESGLKIEEVRNIAQELQYQPVDGITYVVVLGLENASIPAQQALLKMLEEPPSYVLWLLLTANLASILPTIQSRCTAVDISQVGAEISAEDQTTTSDLLDTIVSSSVGDVLALIDTLGDKIAVEHQLHHLLRHLHQQPPTVTTVQQMKHILETQRLISANVNLKLALGECFLALRKAGKEAEDHE